MCFGFHFFLTTTLGSPRGPGELLQPTNGQGFQWWNPSATLKLDNPLKTMSLGQGTVDEDLGAVTLWGSMEDEEGLLPIGYLEANIIFEK